MDELRERFPSRIERIREVHRWMHPGFARALLCYAYKQAMNDPTVAGNEDNAQIRLECLVDVLRRSSEDEARNELAKVLEWFPELDPDEVSFDDEKQAYIDYLKSNEN
jgi:alpha-L-fucosidase